MPTKTPIADPGPTPAHVNVEIRGRRYTFTELEISEYNKLLKQATSESVDNDGNEVEITDNTLLMQLMVLKSSNPKLTADEVGAMGTRMYRAIAGIVNDLHYSIEPIKILPDDDNGLGPEPEAKEESGKG